MLCLQNTEIALSFVLVLNVLPSILEPSHFNIPYQHTSVWWHCSLSLLYEILKVGFHYPSSRAELMARELGCIFWHPSTRVVETGRPCTQAVYTGVCFPLPELTARVDGCQKMHLISRAVNSARELGPWTRVVETDLYYYEGAMLLQPRVLCCPHMWSRNKIN